MIAAPLLLAAVVCLAPPVGAAAERVAEDALEAKLDAPPPAWPDLTGQTFLEALDRLGDAAGVAVLPDRPALAAAGVDLDAVPFDPPSAEDLRAAPPPTLRAAFGVLLDARGGAGLTLENRAGLLRVSTPEAAGRRLSARVYDVRGLAAALGVTDVARGRVVQRVAGRGAGTEPVKFDPPLIHALKTGVGGRADVAEWDVDGRPAAIAELGGRLVVRQTAAGHAALARLLDDLRATASRPASDQGAAP